MGHRSLSAVGWTSFGGQGSGHETVGADVRLVSLRVSNYRTTGSAQVLPLNTRTSIVGPNNSGKTNLLRAVELLFTGNENRLGYDRERDLTFGVSSAKTSLLATFDGNPVGSDARLYAKLDQLHELLGTERLDSDFTMSLQFSANSNPSYQFFPNAAKPKNGSDRALYSSIKNQLVGELLGSFKCHYVPSAKSISDLYDDLLMPFLRGLAAQALDGYLPELQQALSDVAAEINLELDRVGLGDLSASFSLPQESAESLFSSFDLNLADPNKTLLANKGQGIQSTALLASLLWITREERQRGLSSIWLLEEPESYLHPELSRSCVQLLEELRKEAQVIVTTHALAFVPQDPESIVGCDIDEGETRLATYKTYADATKKIRDSLGVKFSDFYSLGALNLLVEGPSDRELISWALISLTSEGAGQWPLLSEAELLDFGGVGHLAGFLRATWEMIRDERAAIAVFDGDDAGVKERKALQRYFGQKDVGFEANRDYVSVRDRFAIEGLFPDEWIIDLHDENPTWFENYSVDTGGVLEPYKIKDARKARAQKHLIDLAEESEGDLDWANRWILFLDACERALATQKKRVDNLAGP